VFAGLLGGIFWNLITWSLGLPSSSSHALIGGVVGAVLVAAGTDAVIADGLVGEVLVPAVIAAVLALAVAAVATFLVYRMIARIIRTLAHRVTKIGAPQGFTAETSSATVILAASQAGFPLSTTHVTSGAVMVAGVGRRAAEVHWGIAGQMALAWLVTLPAAGALAAGFYLLTDALGPEIAGPIAASALAAAGAAWLYFQTQRSGAVRASDV
jgi:inorganic phosphate transporter, PiT family